MITTQCDSRLGHYSTLLLNKRGNEHAVPFLRDSIYSSEKTTSKGAGKTAGECDMEKPDA